MSTSWMKLKLKVMKIGNPKHRKLKTRIKLLKYTTLNIKIFEII